MIRAIALIALLAGCATQPSGPTTAYEGARLILGDGRVIENGTILVQDGKIARVGEARAPEGATRVNLAGKTVMPMIIDTHVHLGTTREALVRDLRRRAYYGVGAAMSLGTDGYELLDMRGETIPGAARFKSAGRGITMQEPGRTTVPYWVNTPADGRKAVEELAARKVDIVKIWVDTRDGKYKKLSPEIYGAIIDEAHKRSLRVTAHIFDLEDAKGLLRAGVDALAHGVRDRDIDDELVAMFRQRPNLVLTPNLPPRGTTPVAQQLFGIQARNLAKLNAAGVRITLGTDGNTPAGPHEEMQDMVIAGMTPMQVIVAATRNSAEFMRLTDAGTLQAGKSADFIVLDANPLDDITNTRRISAVVLRGAALDRSKAP
jgi:imidazolonepropionase-like amidohydrolase